ncbi:hypothetical protein JTB14_022141 [Gonioctena quinquepunctata]|nr:hypothetical protein JTB14_022141 [Gonioctena quinquepunctata]
MLTLEKWNDENNTYLIRLEHTFEKNEDSSLSDEVTVDIATIFGKHGIKEIKETTLGANIWLDDFKESKKFTWVTKTNGDTVVAKGDSDESAAAVDEGTKITLKPMEIRTFIIKI